MSLITGSANASVDLTSARFAPSITGLVAGEALKNCAFVFIASDGDVEESDIVSGSVTCGIVARQANSGEPVTIYGAGTIIGNYSSGLTPGTVLYLSDTDPGSLEDAATVADTGGSALVISETDIRVERQDMQNRGEGF